MHAVPFLYKIVSPRGRAHVGISYLHRIIRDLNRDHNLRTFGRMNPELVKRSLKEEILKPRYRDAIGPVVNSVLLEQGLAAQLCNGLFMREEKTAQALKASRDGGDLSATASTARAYNSPLPAPCSEELSVITAMIDKWQLQLHGTLQALCEETGQPLMRVGHGTGNPTKKPSALSLRGWLYTTDDLLALVEGVKHPNQVTDRTGAKPWCLTPIALWTPRLPQLRQMFAELAPTERQSGLDDELRGWFAEERYTVGSRLLATSYAPLLRQFARCGVPPGLRGKLWLGALQVGALSERDYNYYATLQREVARVSLVTDDMVRRDAAHPSREEDYFVFAEMVEELLLAFCRDPVVSQRAAHPRPQPITARGKAGQRYHFPPNGVPPFKGLSDFLCPLCFVYAQPPELYHCFRAMWCRYWCRLHSMSSTPGSLLPLLRLFEDLLQECAPAVCLHLLRLEMPPGSVAVHWIASAFGSFLPAEQTLVLWDRIIGFDSLELLPILAAAVFVYRAKWLLQASEQSHVQRLLSDATGLRVVPLLQLFLAGESQPPPFPLPQSHGHHIWPGSTDTPLTRPGRISLGTPQTVTSLSSLVIRGADEPSPHAQTQGYCTVVYKAGIIAGKPSRLCHS